MLSCIDEPVLEQLSSELLVVVTIESSIFDLGKDVAIVTVRHCADSKTCSVDRSTLLLW
jgi:hypothetical protein